MPMQRLSAKLLRTHHDERHGCGGHVAHWCPGCEEWHEFAVDRPFHNGARWSFDGNLEAPTFAPSMNIRVGPYPDDSEQPGRVDVCHYFLTAGRIQFLPDCTHALSGQTVPLPDLPDQVLMQIRASQAYAVKS